MIKASHIHKKIVELRRRDQGGIMNFTPKGDYVTVTLPNAEPLANESSYYEVIAEHTSVENLNALDEFLDDDSVRGLEEYEVTLKNNVTRHLSMQAHALTLSIPNAVQLLTNAYRIVDTSPYTRTVITDDDRRIVYTFGENQTTWDAINVLQHSEIFDLYDND